MFKMKDFPLSTAAREAHVIASGSEPGHRAFLELDLSQWSTEERERLVKQVGVAPSEYSYPSGWKSPAYSVERQVWLETILPSMEARRVELEAAEAVRVAKELQNQARSIASRIEKIREWLNAPTEAHTYRLAANKHYPGINSDYAPNPSWGEAEGYAEHVELWQQLKQRCEIGLPIVEAERAEADEKERIAKEQLEAQRKLEREAQKQARLEWARAHGSKRLREGLEQGFDCKSLYEEEWLEHHFAGAVYDHGGQAETQDRSCPTLEALTQVKELREKHPEVKLAIVWLKAPPKHRGMSSDSYYELQARWEGQEAILIDAGDLSHYAYLCP